MSTSLPCRQFETESGEGSAHSGVKVVLHLILTVEVNFLNPKKFISFKIRTVYRQLNSCCVLFWTQLRFKNNGE